MLCLLWSEKVKQAAEKVGFKKLFWRIKQKPGTPVAALMRFHNYVKPVLSALQGGKQLQRPISFLEVSDKRTLHQFSVVLFLCYSWLSGHHELHVVPRVDQINLEHLELYLLL